MFIGGNNKSQMYDKYEYMLFYSTNELQGV